MRNHLYLLAFLASLNAACGSSSSSSTPTVRGPVISGSSNSGVLFTAVAFDSSIKTARVYHYEFATGTVREIYTGDSADPAIFWADDHAFLFNRQADQLSVRTFDPRLASSSITAEEHRLGGLNPGDPWDVSTLVPGSKVLLASPLGGKLQSFDYQTKLLTDESTTSMRPVALLPAGGKIHVLSSGIKDGISADGSQSLFSVTATSEGTLQLGASQAIHPSNPLGFFHNSDSATTIVGLCSNQQRSCVAAADSYAPSSGSVRSLASYDDNSVPYRYKNKAVNAASSTTIYAHVESADNSYQVIKLDTTSKEASVVHTFADANLYGIAFDDGSKTLFVGDHNGRRFQLKLYRNDLAVGSIDLDGAPYNFAFIPE